MVMFVTRYIRGRPKAPTWNPAMTLYVCEHRYRDETRSFKKIKNWQSCLPEEVRKHEYTLEPHRDDGVESLVRVPSPFVRGIKGPGGLGDPTDGPEDDQIKYHVQPDGQPATAESAREANRREDERRHQQEEAAAQAAAAQAAAAAMMSSTSGLFPLLGDSANFFDSSGGGNIDANAGGVDTPMFNAPPPVELPTPAEMAVSQEAFEPLPPNISESSSSSVRASERYIAWPLTCLCARARQNRNSDQMRTVTCCGLRRLQLSCRLSRDRRTRSIICTGARCKSRKLSGLSTSSSSSSRRKLEGDAEGTKGVGVVRIVLAGLAVLSLMRCRVGTASPELLMKRCINKEYALQIDTTKVIT